MPDSRANSSIRFRGLALRCPSESTKLELQLAGVAKPAEARCLGPARHTDRRRRTLANPNAVTPRVFRLVQRGISATEQPAARFVRRHLGHTEARCDRIGE
jgi:hypothetical protein